MTPYFQSSDVTIFNADWRDFSAPDSTAYDLLLTDPPYGTGRSEGTGQYGRDKWEATDKVWDTETPPITDLQYLAGNARKSIIWGSNYFPLPPSRNFVVWDKGAGFKGRSFAEAELAWCSWDANAIIIPWDPLAKGDYRGKGHPTQKPNYLFQRCIQHAGLEPGAVILDAYAGSGTTGRAARALGMKAVLFEREESYCEYAARSLQQQFLDL